MAIQSQLFSSQDLGMENNNICGLKQFAFNLQERPENKPLQYQPSMQYHHQNTQSLQQQGGINITESSQNLASLMQRQTRDIDYLVMFQGESLKRALEEQNKLQLSLILKRYEEKIEFLLKQKDEEISKALHKKMELEEFMKRMELENEVFQYKAKENEELVFSLSNTIEQLRQSFGLSTNGVENAESCCENIVAETIQIQVEKEERLEQIPKKVLCKGCNIRSSCIIILPCRHLCLCQTCETFLHSCLVCGTEKKATIQALI